MEKSIKSIASDLGLYLGILLSLYTLTAYLIDLGLIVNIWLMMLIIPLVIVGFGIFSTAKAKSFNNGFLTFKQAFSSYFITVAIGIMISTLVTVVIFNFIDPEAAVETKNILVENTATMMKNSGAPTETIAEKITEIESQDTFAIGVQLKSLAQSLIFFAVIGLIVAAALKKSNPEAE
ncbi:DUF4199 domain-containing protein [Tamlana haliotis]|uniref:DUF4199 domain-containing protein n=1 Tax=Pseudotamlana haliotis TaxID=2614804 RepID=A0A6N6MM74_9FLAO|nr:DUF4199 domain-containing protein [Tamlana haliotis]KAB1069403.1 DUF4199 domain-containing protein [Tamlana haliotis]